nr:MAG: hypothetical protein [Cressdnaviricota sp.]
MAQPGDAHIANQNIAAKQAGMILDAIGGRFRRIPLPLDQTLQIDASTVNQPVSGSDACYGVDPSRPAVDGKNGMDSRSPLKRGRDRSDDYRGDDYMGSSYKTPRKRFRGDFKKDLNRWYTESETKKQMRESIAPQFRGRQYRRGYGRYHSMPPYQKYKKRRRFY